MQNICNRVDLTDVPLSQILSECELSEKEYYDALDFVSKRVTILYKRKPNEQNVSPYNTVILSLMQSNMNIQYVTGIYGVVKYLTGYMCKPEHTMSELMKKASKEATNKGVQDKLWAIGNVFTQKREVSTDEAIVRTLSLPMRSSKIDVVYIVTGLKENRTRALKSPEVLKMMNADDENVYALNLLDKYANRPDQPIEMEDLCLADFGTNYVHHKAYDPNIESEDIRSYTTPVSSVDFEDEESSSKAEIITLKDEMGKMRKRKRPCVMRYHNVNEMVDPELHYLILLQLYLPWRNENELKRGFSSYEEMYKHVEEDIKPNILRHEPYFESQDMNLDLNDLERFDNDEDDNNDNRTQFNFLNPDLLDLDMPVNETDNTSGVAATSNIQNRSISREENYEMCSRLNDEQLDVFNYVMRYAIEVMFNERNDKDLPEPIYVFLSGGGGVGKSYVSKAMIENLKNVLKFHPQNFDTQPSVSVTASTGKAACILDGTTIHSAFGLGKFGRSHTKADGLNTLRRKYNHLCVLLTDEISMTGITIFDNLNTQLQAIKNDKRDFGGVSIIAIGDLFQLPPVNMATVYALIHKRINDVWLKFKLHELTKIVRQSDDPEFAAILSRVREGKHTSDDIVEIKKLEHTDTSSWPEEYTHLYMTNHLSDVWNKTSISKLENSNNPIVTINAYDTGPTNTIVPATVKVSDTSNLQKVLKLCEGAKVLITNNIDIKDKIVNGTIGTIVKLDRVGNDLSGKPKGRIYIKCDDPIAGNNHKDNRLRGELKECVPISPLLREFTYTGKSIKRLQFPLLLAHAITAHKSQGSTVEYFLGDLDRTPGPGKTKQNSVQTGMFYTMLSRAKVRKNVKLRNFEESCINTSQSALKEMERLRKESVLDCSHPLKKLQGSIISLLNIVKWTKHIEHFLSDTAHSLYSSVFCFTETNIGTERYHRINNFLPEWDDVHEITTHGLAICYNTAKVKFLKRFTYIGVLEILPVLLEIEGEIVFLVLVYRRPGPIGTFVNTFIQTIDQILADEPIQGNYRTLILGDFNWDQMLPQHVVSFNPFILHFRCHQRSNYTTHGKGGILDLVFDDKRDTDVDWMFSPYSDHFILLIEL